MSHLPPTDIMKKDAPLADYSTIRDKLNEQAKKAARLFPFLVTESFASKINWNNPSDPLLLQILPNKKELRKHKEFVTDPLQENKFRTAPGLIKKYRGRVVLQLTSACPIHCRYCFRRHNKNSTAPKNLTEWQAALETIRSDNSIKEVIYSGGDPLMVANDRLLELSNLIAEIPHIQRVRIHTRVPVTSPKKITPTLINGLKKVRLMVSMVIHMNHPAEMDDSVKLALAAIVDSGIPLYNQSVLLKGVNDNVETLTKLSELLIQARVTPYYLHLLDPVAGATHFRVGQKRAKKLIRQMRNHLPGFAVPLLVRDIPGKMSKTPIL